MTSEQKKELQKVLTSSQLTAAYHDYGKGLSSYAFFKVRNRVTSEDLVQDTFLKTWKYLAKGGKVELMKAFLYHVLNNLIVDQYRKHKTVSLDALVEKGFDRSIGDDSRLFNTLDGKAVMGQIGRLPKIYQKVMNMKYIQQLTLKEMSLITGQSRNTMAVQAHRGLEKLKSLYIPV